MSTDIRQEDIRIKARDGYSLSGLIVVPENPKAAVLISSGTGFPKELYRRMARKGAEMGYACLLYDYRGITASAPDDLNGFEADIVDWARLDFSAALDHAQALAFGKPLFTLGHSVGGHLLGFADNALKPKAHAFIATMSGYWWGLKPAYRLQALLFWMVLGPLNLNKHGFIPAGGRWGGTALPKGIFQQWRDWSYKSGYIQDVMEQLKPHHFHDITAPIRNWGFGDDAMASVSSMESLLATYTKAPKELIMLDPADLGAKRIGHYGAFKPQGEAFWPKPFEWFDEMV